MRLFLHVLAFVVATALVTGCGGGGSGSSPSNSQAQAISVDKSVPAAAASAVVQIQTPAASAAMGSPVAFATATATGDSVAFGTDANGNILLATLNAGPNTSLSATSTALVFARIALGALPASAPNTTQIQQGISSTAEFPNLVTLINTALQSATPPATSTAVQISVATVAQQYLTMLPSQLVVSSSATPTKSGRMRPADDSAVTPLPYTIIESALGKSTAFGSVYISAATSSGVSIVNDMLIEWDASVPPANGVVQLLPTDLTGALSAPAAKPVPGLSTSFELDLTANNAANLKGTLTNALTLSLSMMLPTNCAGQVSQSVVQLMTAQNGFQAAENAESGNTARTLLTAWVDSTDFTNNFTVPLVACAGANLETNAVFQYFDLWTKFNGAITLGAVSGQTFASWGQTVATQVCLSGNNLVNCTMLVLPTGLMSVAQGSSIALNVGVVPAPSLPSPLPTYSGTVSFVDGYGTTLCDSATPNSSGVVTCRALFPASTPTGNDAVTITFSGDNYYATSQATLNVNVTCTDGSVWPPADGSAAVRQKPCMVLHQGQTYTLDQLFDITTANAIMGVSEFGVNQATLSLGGGGK